MHLGQTATYLATVMNRPEASLKLVSRLLREAGWVRKGPRGRNAPHLSADELASFILTIMCAPDSPATAMERLPHFHSLPLEDDETGKRTFGRGLGVLLARLAAESADEAERKMWRVVLSIDLSMAVIEERFWNKKDSEYDLVEHCFSALISANPQESVLNSMPFHSGMGIHISVPWFTLFRIAKTVLENEPDPLPALAARLTAAS